MADFLGFSWLAKSCIPDSCRRIAQSPTSNPRHHNHNNNNSSTPSILLSLPDDLLLDIFSRIPLPSLPSLSLACRRFSLLLAHPSFHHLRRARGLLRRSLLSLRISHPNLLSAAAIPIPFPISLQSHAFLPKSIPFSSPPGAFSQPRLAALGRFVYVIGKGATLRYDPLTGSVAARAPTLFARKRFAAAAVGGRIYVSGGATRSSAVEEYDPEADEWRVVAEAPRRRYGCVGATAGGVFYAIGGLTVGCGGEEGRGAGTMDGYRVGAGTWLRARAAVPGGGCVVGACGAGAHVYVLASHAVEVALWRWDGKGRRGGDWTRLEPPPVVAGQLRVGGGVHFSCASVGDGKLAALVHASGRGAEAGVTLVYDIEADEWSRGPDLPNGLRRAACAGVEC